MSTLGTAQLGSGTLGEPGGVLPQPPLSLHVHDRLPLPLRFRVRPPNAAEGRWGDDAGVGDVPDGTTLSSTMPGGHESASARLAREIERAYPDLAQFSDVVCEGVDGTTAWHGRFQRDDRESGSDSSISPTLVGWQAHLSDNKAAQMLPVDRDLNAWGPMGRERRISLISGAWALQEPSVTHDLASGLPTVTTELGQGESMKPDSEAFYHSPIPIERVVADWERGSNVSAADSNYQWQVWLSDTDAGVGEQKSGNLRAAGPGQHVLVANTATRRVASLLFWYVIAASWRQSFEIRWRPAVYGLHGLPLHGDEPKGVRASDVITHAVGRWAPLLTIGEIAPSSFVIPHTGLLAPTVTAIIDATLTRYEDAEEAVWGREFTITPPGSGTSWLARVGPEQLRSTGSDADRIYNAAIVYWTDVDGTRRSAGPPGSGMQVEDPALQDPDPENPATAVGITKPLELELSGTAVAASAIEVGRRALILSRRTDNSGQASFTGYVTNYHTGAEYPAWRVRAGDTVVVVDAADQTPRHITRAQYDGRDTTTVDLDAPPETLEQTLERMQAAIVSRV